MILEGFADYGVPASAVRLYELCRQAMAELADSELERRMLTYGPGLIIKGSTSPKTGIPKFDLDDEGRMIVMWGEEELTRIDPAELTSDDNPN